MLSDKTVTVDSDGRPRDYLGNHASKYLKGYEPEKDKGERGGSCNFTSCQSSGAVGLHTNGKWYCLTCTYLINNANRGDPVWTPIKIDEAVQAEYEKKLEENA